MKVKAAVILCILATIGAWPYANTQPPAHPTPSPETNGRYQMVQADVDFTSFGAKLKHKTIIKMDTQTGEAWEFMDVNGDKGGEQFAWVKISQ